MRGCIACAIFAGWWMYGAPATAHEPAPGTKQTYRLGFQGSSTDEGLKVVSIRPNSPILRMKDPDDAAIRGVMDIGDVIVEVDEKPVHSLEDYFTAMDASVPRQGSVLLKVLDIRTGGLHKWKVTGAPAVVATTQADAELRKCHFLLVGLTKDPGIGPAQSKNIENLKDLIEGGAIRSERLGEGGVHVLQDNNCRREAILDEVQTLPVTSRDALFVYFGGHGAYDPNGISSEDKSNGHFVVTESGNLRRFDLWQTMLNKHARLTVLITDTCNKKGSYAPPSPFQLDELSREYRGFSSFETLMLGYRGVVDLSGAAQDEFGWCQGDRGGWFTFYLVNVLRDVNDWQNAYDRLRVVVDDYYVDKRAWLLQFAGPDLGDRRMLLEEQMHQTPYAFSLDVRRDDEPLAVPDNQMRTMTAPVWKEPVLAQ
jgi:hypothetical protein